MNKTNNKDERIYKYKQCVLASEDRRFALELKRLAGGINGMIEEETNFGWSKEDMVFLKQFNTDVEKLRKDFEKYTCNFG